MGYCFTCGTTADDLDATAMCAACRAAWRPSAPAAADLGTRNPHATARPAGQAADLRLRDSRITFPQVGASSKLGPGQA